jgi:NifU-like protein involved in Fe-S cluster formation
MSIVEMDDDMSRLQVDIPEDLKTACKVEAVKKGITLSELVESALKAYLEQIKAKK